MVGPTAARAAGDGKKIPNRSTPVSGIFHMGYRPPTAMRWQSAANALMIAAHSPAHINAPPGPDRDVRSGRALSARAGGQEKKRREQQQTDKARQAFLASHAYFS